MSGDKFGRDRHAPTGDWARASEYLEAVGVHHRLSSTRQFASAVREAERRKLRYGIRLQPEPSNPHDRNAIRLVGHCEVARLFGGPAVKEWHVGYVDRETAERLNAKFISRGASLEGELYGIYVSDDGYIDINYFALSEPDAVREAKLAERSQTVNEALSDALTKKQAEYVSTGLLGLYRNTRLGEAKALKSSGQFEQAVEHYLRVAALDAFGVSNAMQGMGRSVQRSDVFTSDDFQALRHPKRHCNGCKFD